MSGLKDGVDAARAQKLAALDIANQKRKNVAGLKRLLREGKVDADLVLRGDVPWAEEVIENWTVEQMLKAIPHIGTSRMFKIIGVSGVSPSMKLSKMTYVRRCELAEITMAARGHHL